MRIDQFHSGVGFGDAITNGMFYIQRLLREAGVEGDIYAEHIDPKIEHLVLPLKMLRPRPDAGLLWQHSMGHDSLDRLLTLPQRKILIYQNITPPKFFGQNHYGARYAQLGLDQLKAIAENCDILTTPSAFNAADIRARVSKPVVSMPLLTDIPAILARPARFDRLPDMNGRFNFLTVSRVVPHKGQLGVVEIASRLLDKSPGAPFRWWIVGGWNPGDAYHADLVDRIERAGLQDVIRLTGMVSDEELVAFYRACDALVLTSEHEGFSVPIVEGFVYDLPVFANNVGAMPETLNGGGVIVDTGAPDKIAAELHHLMTDRGRRREIIKGQRLARRRYDTPAAYNGLRDALAPIFSLPEHDFESAFADEAPFEVRGPFFGAYSLATVNRNTLLGLDNVTGEANAAYLTEGPGDIPVTEAQRKLRPELADRADDRTHANVPRWTIDYMWPPRPQDARGLYVAPYFAWEESLVPKDLIDRFNLHTDAVFCSSRFTAKVLRDSGYRGPAPVVWGSVDEEWRAKYDDNAGKEPPLGKMIKPNQVMLLHVSSGFPRKGIDTLMRAYREMFDANAEIVLYLKTTPNPHQQVDRLWSELNFGAPNAPRFIHCSEELSLEEMVWLHKRADAIVTLTRGEGYCIPVAEAIHMGKPVVFPRHSGLLDFPRTGAEIPVDWDYDESGSHLSQSGSLWFSPRLESAKAALQKAVTAARAERARRLRPRTTETPALAYADDVGARIVAAAANVETHLKTTSRKPLKVAWLSSFGRRCGIADYSTTLLEHAAAASIEPLVLASEITESLSTLPAPAHQAWNDSSDKSLDQAFDDLMRFGAEAVVVQFNFGFYALPVLEAFARRVKQAGLPLVIEMHAVQMAREGFPGETLASQPGLWDVVDRVLLHTTQDMNLLAGFVDPLKLTLFPHASFAGEERSMAEVRRHLDLADHHPVIATYGFFLPGKGLDTAIDVHQQILARYPNALLLMVNAEYPSPVSRAEIERVESIICSRGLEDSVIMLTQYLSNEDSQILLQAADVVILPYAPSKESASGSVRRAMAAGRPVVVSDQSIFGDLSSIVATADARQPATFADTVLQVLGDPRRTANIVARQEKWMRDHAPAVLSERLFGMITGLALDAKIPSGATTHDSAADKPAKKRPVEVAGSSRAATPAKRPRRRSIDAAE